MLDKSIDLLMKTVVLRLNYVDVDALHCRTREILRIISLHSFKCFNLYGGAIINYILIMDYTLLATQLTE